MSMPDLSKLSRRRLLGAAAGAGVATPLALGGLSAIAQAGVLENSAAALLDKGAICTTRVAATGAAPIKLRFAWNTGAVCGAPVAAAQEGGIFAKHGLDVEFINFAGSTEALLETLATGKADAAHGMALRWLKPLEQGFDVKIVAGLHSGCLRLLAGKDKGIASVADLRGKTVAISDLASPSKNFFAIQLAKQGIDPEAEVNWRVFPGELLGAVVERGEADAVAHWDPLTYKFLQTDQFVEIATNMDGEYARRTCCIVGVRNSLLDENAEAVQRLVRALVEAEHFTVENPQIAAKAYQPFSPNTSIEDLEIQIRYHGHHHSPSGEALRQELAQYTEELKLVGVMRPRTDPEKFANKIYAPIAA
jgi:NitT/TauT family transport system substrate-binding protein